MWSERLNASSARFSLIVRYTMEIGRPYSRLLRRMERLGALEPHDRQRICELPLVVTNVAANQEITHRGDKPSRCALVLGGFLYTYRITSGARRQITSFVIPGDFADLQAAYLQSVDYNLSALGPAVVAFLPNTALKDMLDRSPQLAQAFWRESFIEAAIYREWITNIGRRESLARVAHLICELAARLRTVDLARNLRFAIPMTQAELADACGISSVHANRVVQELRRQGLVEWDSRQVRIRNWSGLARIGDFSAEYLQVPDGIEHAASSRETVLEEV
jgi:CRP-like cAMP-binding protein